MADRYKVEDLTKEPPEIVWEGMALSAHEAMTAASMEKDIPIKSLVAEIIPLPLVGSPQSSVKVHKPRADAGGKHNKAEKPKKRRIMYHLVKGELDTFISKEELDAELNNIPDLANLKVIEGGSIHSVEFQKTWKLA